MKDLHIVTGLQGSGTSLMMRILGFGGMSVVYNEKEKKVLDSKKKFRLPQDIVNNEKIFTQFNGSCIKLPIERAIEVPINLCCKIILMLRTPEDIRVTTENKMSDYQQRIKIEEAVRVFKSRKNISLVCVCFRDLIAHTEAVVKHLQYVGWGVDYKKATYQFQKYSEDKNGTGKLS